MSGPSSIDAAGGRGRHRPERWSWFLLALVLLALAPRAAALFSESVNWDEFALLARADRTLRLGVVAGDGRPGLATMLLMPFVRGCTDSVAAVVHARVLWLDLTLVYLAGVYCLVRAWFRRANRPERGHFEGAVAVALLAFLPAFVTWSVQVRTDQAALAAATWGAVCLLSRRRSLAVMAGVLFGLGVLCSQKAVYVIALGGVLWLGAVLPRLQSAPPGSRGRELREQAGFLALVAAGALATLLVYAQLVPEATRLASAKRVVSAFDEMQWVRARFGYRAYSLEMQRALLHDLLLAALVAATLVASIRRRGEAAWVLATSWAVLALGVAVVMFHGSSFPYFLMTAGLFPAVALGLASGHLASYVGEVRRTVVIALAGVVLVAGSASVTYELLHGMQANQRDTLQWIRSSGLTAYRGYQVEGALFCAADPDPMPGMFSQQIQRRAASSPHAYDDFIEQFRSRPIAYFVDSYRMREFPANVKAFWAEHYGWYYGAVYVAGFDVQAGPGATADVIVPGTYRWVPRPGSRGAVLTIGNAVIRAGETAQLPVGRLATTTDPAGATGRVFLALNSRTGTVVYPFLDPRQLDRLLSRR